MHTRNLILIYTASGWLSEYSVSASHKVGSGFVFRPGHTKDHHKNVSNCLLAWSEFGNATQLCKSLSSVILKRFFQTFRQSGFSRCF